MEPAMIFALAFAITYAFVGDVNAVPTEQPTTTMATTKDIKEPKEIKDAATASKDLKDVIKSARDAKKNKKDCGNCDSVSYAPVCAHDPADSNFKPRTFGTQCALEAYNCEMGSKLAVKSKGECPGSGGVRLS